MKLNRKAVSHEYRDRIYIRKDVLLKLFEYGELSQSKVISYCGLNNAKHKEIIDSMVERGLVLRTEESWGSKRIAKCRVSTEGMEILRRVPEPYEALFPRENEGKAKLADSLRRQDKDLLLPFQMLSSVTVP